MDVLSELSIPHLAATETGQATFDLLSDIEKRVIEVMTREPLHIDQILRRSSLASAQVNSALVQLELKGTVKRFPGQLYVRVK
jgi:DNA processing protein